MQLERYENSTWRSRTKHKKTKPTISVVPAEKIARPILERLQAWCHTANLSVVILRPSHGGSKMVRIIMSNFLKVQKYSVETSDTEK